MTFSNVSSFNSTYRALSSSNIAKESSNTIKKGGAFAPNFAEATSIMRASFDNQWENAYIIKYQALMQNRLNALKQELTAAYNNLLQQASSQQIRENGSNNSISATTDVYGRMLPGTDGAVNQAFKGLTYYGDKSALDAADSKGVWNKSGDSATNADGIPSYYINDATYQYDSAGNQINNVSKNIEMRKLFVSGPAMQIANDMKVTFRSEEVVPKATDNASFPLIPVQPNVNPAFKAGEKVAENSVEVKTGGFWSTVNYLYDFSPRELKYSYATSYSTTTEESGTRTYTDAQGQKQATLYSGKIVDSRDGQAKGDVQTSEDATNPNLVAYDPTATQDNPRFGARVKWATSNPEDGYLTERNPFINLYATNNDKQNAAWKISTGKIDDRLITRRTSDNDTNFPYLATTFNSFNDTVKGNTTAIGTLGTPGYKAPDPWTGYKLGNNPALPNDQQANDVSIYGTEEGGVTDINSRIKWSYQHDGVGVLDTNRDAEIIAAGGGVVTISSGGAPIPTGSIPAGGLTVNATGPFAYYNGATFSGIVGPGTVTIPSGATSMVPASGLDPASAVGLTITAGDSFTYSGGSVASGATVTIPAGATGTAVPTTLLSTPPAPSNNIPSNGITLKNGSTAFTYSGTGVPVPVSAGASASIPGGGVTGSIPAGSSITVSGSPMPIPSGGNIVITSVAAGFTVSVAAPGITVTGSVSVTDSSTPPITTTYPAGSTIPAGSNVTINPGATNITISAGSMGNIPVGSIATLTSSYPIPSSGIIVNSAGSDFSYTPLSSPTTVTAGESVTIPANSIGVIPAGATSLIPAGSTIEMPAGTSYTLLPPVSGADETHVAKAAFINHYQIAVQDVELNSNPDSYGKVLALGHKRVNSNIATSDPYSDSVDPMNAVATKLLRSGGIDASMEHVFSDVDNQYDSNGKLIHQNPVDKDGNGQSTNEKMMLPGSGKIAKNFTPKYVESLNKIKSFNGQSLGANGGNITISSETANSTPVVLGEYEGFKRAQSMSIGLAHDAYNDMGQQVRTYADALALKNKLEAEINASNMVDTDWHYSEYASSTGGSTLDGIMFRNVRKITYNDPDKGAGEFNIYYDSSRRDDPTSNTFQYVDPSTGLSNSMQGTQEDTFDNVNVAFRKTFTLTRDQFQNLDYQQANPLATNPIAHISPDAYTTDPTYKNRSVVIDINTQNVDMNTLDLVVNGTVVSATTTSIPGGTATYDIAPYLLEGDNVIAFQMKVDKTVAPITVSNPIIRGKAVAGSTGSNDYFKLTSDASNNTDIANWIAGKISTTRTTTGDVNSTELTNATNAGTVLSSWQSKIMSNEVRPSLYSSIYPASGADPTPYMTANPTNVHLPSVFAAQAPVVNTISPTSFTLITSTPPGIPSFPASATRPPTDFIAQFPSQGQGTALFSSLYPASATDPIVKYYSPDGTTNNSTSVAPNTVPLTQTAINAYNAAEAKTVYYVDSTTGVVTGYVDSTGAIKNPNTGATYTPPAIPRPVGADVPMSVQAYNAFFNGGPATAFYVDPATGIVNGYVDSTGAIINPSTGAIYTPVASDLKMAKAAYNNYYNGGPATTFYVDPATGMVNGYVDPITGSIKNPTTGLSYTPAATDVKLSKIQYAQYYNNAPAIAYYIAAGPLPALGTVVGVVDPNTGKITNPTTGLAYTPVATDKAMSKQAYSAFTQNPLPKFYVDEKTGQITGNPTDIPMTEQAFNAYGAALMGLGSTKTATKVKDSNTFLKVLMEAMNKKEYQDIFALGLLNSSAGKDIILKGQLSSPSGGSIQSILSIKYDNINNKFSLVQTKWDASGSPQQS